MLEVVQIRSACQTTKPATTWFSKEWKQFNASWHMFWCPVLSDVLSRSESAKLISDQVSISAISTELPLVLWTITEELQKKSWSSLSYMIHDAQHIEGSRPEWCILSMIYSADTPFWSKTLNMLLGKFKTASLDRSLKLGTILWRDESSFTMLFKSIWTIFWIQRTFEPLKNVTNENTAIP